MDLTLTAAAAVAITVAVISSIITFLKVRSDKMDLRKRLDETEEALREQKSVGRDLEMRIQGLTREALTSDDKARRAYGFQQAAVNELKTLAADAGAERATLYIPLADRNDCFLGLAVLATAPQDISRRIFQGRLFSTRDARAVSCFFSRTPVASSSTDFVFDGVSPTSTYSDCLLPDARGSRREPFGVVQLLNFGDKQIERDKAGFSLSAHAPRLRELAQTFLEDGRANLDYLGLNLPKQARRGAVLTFDISNSAALFDDDFRTLAIVEFVQNSADATHKIAVGAGGHFEAYTGDGFVYSFFDTKNDAGNDRDSGAVRAVRAAEVILNSISDVYKRHRVALDVEPLAEAGVFARIGISTGVIHPVTLDDANVRIVSVFGRVPSHSKLACDAAPRDRFAVAIDRPTLFELDPTMREQFNAAHGGGSEKARSRNVSIYVKTL